MQRFSDISMNNTNKNSFNWTLVGIKQSVSGGDYEDIDSVDNLFNNQVEINNPITCVEFDSTGKFLAFGDKSGRISLFKRDFSKAIGFSDFKPYLNFVSHEPEFDYLKSLEIEEKINKLKWLPRSYRDSQFILSTNDKTVKLWRIRESEIGNLTGERGKECGQIDSRLFSDYENIDMASSNHSNQQHLNEEDEENDVFPIANHGNSPNQSNQSIKGGGWNLQRRALNHRRSCPVSVRPSCKNVYANAHAYHINAISVNSDGQTFLSADDLRINLWSLEQAGEFFNVVDIKPANMEELTEVITAAECHPVHCSLFIYSISKGCIRLCDMRLSALCDRHATQLEEPLGREDGGLTGGRSFFSEIISSISDVHFSHSGRYVLSRDYLTLRVWDLRMARHSVEVYPVHEYCRSKLCALYENDYIFDKFECCWSPDDRYIMTGSYNRFLSIFDRSTGQSSTLEVAGINDAAQVVPSPVPQCRVVPSVQQSFSHALSAPPPPPPSSSSSSMLRDISVDSIDFSQRILHLQWHPEEPLACVSSASRAYVLAGFSVQSDESSGSNGLVEYSGVNAGRLVKMKKQPVDSLSSIYHVYDEQPSNTLPCSRSGSDGSLCRRKAVSSSKLNDLDSDHKLFCEMSAEEEQDDEPMQLDDVNGAQPISINNSNNSLQLENQTSISATNVASQPLFTDQLLFCDSNRKECFSSGAGC